MAPSRLINRNINAGRGRTSMRLEPELWEALEEICDRERMTMRDLVRGIERSEHASGRTSAVRVHIINYFRAAACLGSQAQSRHTVHADMVGGELAMSGP